MQEVLPFIVNGHPIQISVIKTAVNGVKWLLCGAWKSLRWFLEAMLMPPPGQEYIEESRNRAMRFMGRF